ncbi:MAG TPA: hypothetical protein VHY18_06325 [Solirubrobacteraceae bacterium]|nr:hypothetical protein [Solirubrobacteraceae bacterium]
MTGFHSDAEFEQPRKRVSVLAARGAARPALLDWLERVYPVRFEIEGSDDSRTVDGVLVLEGARLDEAPERLPRLVLATAERRDDQAMHTPSATVDDVHSTAGHDAHSKAGHDGSRSAAVRDWHAIPPHNGSPSSTVALADDGRLARPLRKRKIAEHARGGQLALEPQSTRDVLARVNERAVWWQSGDGGLHCSLYPLAELGEGQTLRDHLCPGSFMGLLPLLHFLGRLLADQGWKLPAPRAAFVIDDPNLHWPSYGFLKYPQLAAHASRHGYHLAFATVPLDGWRVDARAVATVREHPAALSLLIHGNDHVARELAGLGSDRQAEAAMAQALRRIAALERASGLSVARVMAPPHGVCSEAALCAMYRLGFEAACISRPYPWRDGLPAPSPLAGWHPAELVAGGIPVAPRQALTASREDLVFRALLGQPLILHGHHGDFADGLDLLAQAAADINDLGEVRWGRLDGVAGGGYATRRVDDVLLVQMYSRQVSVDIPEGIATVRVLAQEPLGGAGWHEVRYGADVAQMSFKEGVGVSETLAVGAGAGGALDLELAAERPLDPLQVAAPRRKAWPLARRLLVEGRDRLRPLL